MKQAGDSLSLPWAGQVTSKKLPLLFLQGTLPSTSASAGLIGLSSHMASTRCLSLTCRAREQLAPPPGGPTGHPAHGSLGTCTMALSVLPHPPRVQITDSVPVFPSRPCVPSPETVSVSSCQFPQGSAWHDLCDDGMNESLQAGVTFQSQFIQHFLFDILPQEWGHLTLGAKICGTWNMPN